ncbi:hypothetical protein ZP13_26495 [Salmonella enterica subsp. enterica]|nr:hypothetical protein [Salmonella enterica subsp. enterica]
MSIVVSSKHIMCSINFIDRLCNILNPSICFCTLTIGFSTNILGKFSTFAKTDIEAFIQG